MFVGVVVENFHRCREEQEKEERIRRAAKRALQLEKRRRSKYSIRQRIIIKINLYFFRNERTPVLRKLLQIPIIHP